MTLEELAKRYEILESAEEIKKLHREYMFWVNARQWDDVINCFTEDASVLLPRHGLFKGKSEVNILYKEKVEKSNLGQGRDAHCVLQPVINVDGDKAAGHWLMYVFVSDLITGNVSKLFHGRHDVEYVKENGKWKISSLIFTSPWPEDPESLAKYKEIGLIR